DQRVKRAWAAPDERIELLEILRHDRHRDHPVETAVFGRTAPRKDEERRAESREPRLHNFTDIDADIAVDVHVEKTALTGAQVARHLHELAGKKRLAVAVDEKDRAQLRQHIDDALDALVKPRLLLADLLVRHAAHDLVDLGDRALDGLKDLERMLMNDIERPLDAVVGDAQLVVVVQPGREREQHERQHHRCNHHQLQQADCRLAGGTHSSHHSRFENGRTRHSERPPPASYTLAEASLSDVVWPKFAHNPWVAPPLMGDCFPFSLRYEPDRSQWNEGAQGIGYASYRSANQRCVEPVTSAALAGGAARRLRNCASSASSAQNSEQKCCPAEVRQNST